MAFTLEEIAEEIHSTSMHNEDPLLYNEEACFFLAVVYGTEMNYNYSHISIEPRCFEVLENEA